MKKLLTILICVCSLSLTCAAVDVSQQQMTDLETDALQQALPDEAKQLMPDVSPEVSADFWTSSSEILADAVRLSGGIIKSALQSAAIILFIVLFFAAASIFLQDFSLRAVILACVAALLIYCTRDMKSMIQAGVGCIEDLHTFSKMLLPVMAGASLSSGAVSASAAIYAGASLFLSVLVTFITKFLVPMVYAYIGLAAADAALGEETFAGCQKLIAAVLKGSLRVILFLFFAYMTLTGIISGSADAMAVKAAKMAVSSVVPVIGSMISDASETVLISARMLTNSVGVFGMLAVVSILIIPILKMGLHYLVMFLTTSVCSMFQVGSLTKFLEKMSGALGMLFAMTSCCGVMTFISCICFMKVSVL